MLQFVAYTTNIVKHDPRRVNTASRRVIDDSRMMIQIVASLTIVIYDRNMFVV
jgi:hypothetical protein